MQRRLPIFFVIDVSESMAGDELYQLEEAMRSVISTLRKDPYALETAFISVIAFAGKSKTIVKLTELVAFHQPELPVGGGTGLGGAMTHLMDAIDAQVISTTKDQKGDWRPVVFLFTDGRPTDSTSGAVERWNRDYRNRANLVAVSFGGQADHAVLSRLTENVLVFMDTAPDAFARFAQWVSLSIQSQSRSVKAGDDVGVNLSKLDKELMGVAERGNESSPWSTVDERFACLVGRCEKSKNPYLMKFARNPELIAELDLPYGFNPEFILRSILPLHQSYFELSADEDSGASVNSSVLVGQGPCPHCGAEFALAMCSNCQNIHCVAGPGHYICPWCEGTADYGFGDPSEGMQVNRGRG
jgi:uncharacterized protein YegL